jgi:oxygen-independent coproporphyrinogen-3 oxidase
MDAKTLFEKYKVDTVPSLYIGGGTPSVLGPKRISRLFHGILSLINDTPPEISLEANPESAGAEFLSAAKDAGVSRLSLGVQAFHEQSRLALGRGTERALRNGTLLRQCLKLAAEYFPNAFSVDLMSGLPFQTEEILLHDIECVIGCGPAHISLYALAVSEGTPFFETVRKSAAGCAPPVCLPDSDEAERLWICGRDYLEKNGYGQYEVSNFCLPGKECLHNIRYWRMESWLALGPAASATIIDDEKKNGPAISGFRYTVRPDADLWLEREAGVPPCQTEERIDPLTLAKESILMGFRYIYGPDTELFARRFGNCFDGRAFGSIREAIPETIAAWQKKGLLNIDQSPQKKEIVALTKKGLLFLNRFLLEAFDEIDRYSWS